MATRPNCLGSIRSEFGLTNVEKELKPCCFLCFQPHCLALLRCVPCQLPSLWLNQWKILVIKCQQPLTHLGRMQTRTVIGIGNRQASDLFIISSTKKEDLKFNSCEWRIKTYCLKSHKLVFLDLLLNNFRTVLVVCEPYGTMYTFLPGPT